MATETQAIAPAVAMQHPVPVPMHRPPSASLYVGDLSPDVTEALLYETFNNVGPIASIRVCRDVVTRRSLGYAYVNFQNPADAERALDALNFTNILNRPCRVMWSQRDPSFRRSGVGNLYIKGLDKSIDHKELYDAFSVFGNIASCKVVYDDKGESQGRGFVQFETAEAAEEALNQANGTFLKEKKITVDHFKDRERRKDEQSRTEHSFNNVFIKNLGEDFTEEQLKEKFSQYGEVTSCIIMHDENNKSRGFGFVCFKDPASAKAAVAEVHNTEINGKTVFAGRAMKKHERQSMLNIAYAERRKERLERTKGVNLYVKNIHENWSNDKLRESFETFGAIASAVVMMDENGRSRGFGFVCFQDQADATRAITDMNGRLLEGKPLYVALAQSKEERRQFLTQQHRSRQHRTFYGGMYPPMMYQNPYQRFPQMYPTRYGANPMMMNRPFPQGYGGQFQQRMPPMGGRQNRPGAVPQRSQNRQQAPSARYNKNRADAAAPMDAQAAAPQSGTQQLASLLASATDTEHRKQILGDNLYQIITSFYPQQAAKLTGMLLQMDINDLMHLLEDHATLRAEVDKAHEVLMAHNTSN